MNTMIYKNRAQAKSVSGLSYIGNINNSAKIVKNKKVNNYTYVIYLAAASTSGYNVCTHSTPECRLGCLNTSGRVRMETTNKRTITNSRIRKTKLFYEHREFFMRWVIAEIKAYQEKAKRDNYNFSIRLNGTSDIEWESVIVDGKNLFQMFPDVQFYDYTKNINRFLNKTLPKNYYLTYSYSGRNLKESLYLLSKGHNVAVVFNTKKTDKFPEYWNGYKVLNGDLTDYRPLDERGCVVGLTWKTIADKTNDRIIRNSVFVEQIKTK